MQPINGTCHCDTLGSGGAKNLQRTRPLAGRLDLIHIRRLGPLLRDAATQQRPRTLRRILKKMKALEARRFTKLRATLTRYEPRYVACSNIGATVGISFAV